MEGDFLNRRLEEHSATLASHEARITGFEGIAGRLQDGLSQVLERTAVLQTLGPQLDQIARSSGADTTRLERRVDQIEGALKCQIQALEDKVVAQAKATVDALAQQHGHQLAELERNVATLARKTDLHTKLIWVLGGAAAVIWFIVQLIAPKVTDQAFDGLRPAPISSSSVSPSVSPSPP